MTLRVDSGAKPGTISQQSVEGDTCMCDCISTSTVYMFV